SPTGKSCCATTRGRFSATSNPRTPRRRRRDQRSGCQSWSRCWSGEKPGKGEAAHPPSPFPCLSYVPRMKIGLVQMAMGPEPDANLAKGVAKVREAARAGAKIVCLPELFRSLYFAQREDAAQFALAEPIPGPSTQALAPVAKETGCVIIVPVFERRAAGLYHNSVAVLDADGRTAGLYRKMHIPDDPAYYEKFYFAPGDLGFKAFDTKAGRVGALVCWDQWYPEGARLTALQGAGVLFFPT